MIIGESCASCAKEKNYPKVTSKNEPACCAAIFLAWKMATPSRPLKHWKNLRERWKCRSISFSTMAISRRRRMFLRAGANPARIRGAPAAKTCALCENCGYLLSKMDEQDRSLLLFTVQQIAKKKKSPSATAAAN